MKALFNCSCIKNVYLRLDLSSIELEITYINDTNTTWKSRMSLHDISDKKYHKGRYETAYNTIKKALLEKETFVEFEI